jgi:hypothetical protein
MLDIEPAATAAQLSLMLCAAGTWGRTSVADWLQQQGVERPAPLRAHRTQVACHIYLAVRPLIYSVVLVFDRIAVHNEFCQLAP